MGQKPEESELMNRTAYYLGMKSCKEGRDKAKTVVEKIKNNELDSAYFFEFGGFDNSKVQKSFDSLMFNTYKLKVLSPGWQPILECYMNSLDSLLKFNFGEQYKKTLWQTANKLH